MQHINKLLLRQIQKQLGDPEEIPGNYFNLVQAVSASYDHYEKDRHLLERSIELSSAEMIELNEQLRAETKELKKAHDELKATERIRLEKRLDEEKIKKLQEITQAVIEVQERERSYLAAELHDNINQVLATSVMYLDTAIKNEEVRLNLVAESKDFIHNAMEEIRGLCRSLLPPSLSKTSLLNALNDLIKNIKQVDKVKIIPHWENINEAEMCEKIKLAIFRIIQEQLNNIFKHAWATTVFIRLIQCNGGLQLSIKDDGVGFDTSQKRNGVGLQNITNRANLFNGEVIIDSHPGAGCELVVIFRKQVEDVEHKIAN